MSKTILVTTTTVQGIMGATGAGATGATGSIGTTGATGVTYPWLGTWLTGQSYLMNDTVYHNGNGYVCLIAHTSGAFNTDLASGDWELFVAQGATGATGSLTDPSCLFRVYMNAAANTGNSAFAQVVFDTEVFDVGSNFASGTFTAPTTGYYQFNWGIQATCDATARSFIASLFVAGSEYSRGVRHKMTAGSIHGSSGSDIIHLTSGQAVDVRAFADVPLALGVGAVQLTYFSGMYLGT